MLDIEEANYERSRSCRNTRVWEMARIGLSRGPRGAAAPLDELSFMSSSSQQGQPSALQPPINELSSTSPPPSVAAAHPFGYLLSFRPSPPQVPTRAPAPPDELPSSPNVAADSLDGFVSIMHSPEVSGMPAVDDGEVFIDAAPQDEDISPTRIPAPPDELPSTLSSPSVIGDDAPDGFVSVIPSPELRSVRAALDNGFFIDDSSVISPTQVPGGTAAPPDESSSPLQPPPPPPFLPEGHPFDYFFTLLSSHFGRTNAASLDEHSSTPSSPSVADDFSVVHSPQTPAMAGDAHHDEFSFRGELPTEDVIIGGSECISGPNGDSCTICLEKYKASVRLRLIRKCNHCFHSDCLEQWLHRKNTCPICRTNVI